MYRLLAHEPFTPLISRMLKVASLSPESDVKCTNLLYDEGGRQGPSGEAQPHPLGSLQISTRHIRRGHPTTGSAVGR